MKLNSFSCAFCAFVLFFNSFSYAQPITVNATQTPQQLIDNVLLGMGVVATNITVNGNPALANTPMGNITLFSNTNPTFPLPTGVLLTTGNGIAAIGPNTSQSFTNNIPPTANVSTDPHLSAIANATVTNGVILEFDFVPAGDSVVFRYIFGSDEYPEFSPSTFNDAFGLFLWGPGITGPHVLAGYPNGGENIAYIPGTTTPITINNLGPGATQYPQFYVDNTNINSYGDAIQYDGTTTVMTAEAAVQCNQTYHIKFAISNVVDQAYDSGVFLEAGSFASDAVAVTVATVSGDTTIIEGCTDANFIFTRPQTQLNDTLIINYTITGTADSLDYDSIPNPIIFLPGNDSINITLHPLQDSLNEGFESVIISVEIINPCGDTIISQGTIWIGDGPILNITENDTLVLCASDSVLLHASCTGGYAPYSFVWNTGDTTNTSWGAIYQNGSVDYYVTATDNCGFSQTDTVTITMNQILTLDTIISLPSSCVPTGSVSATVTGITGTPIYTWSGPGSNSSSFINASIWQNLSSGWYYFNVVDDVCSLSDSAYIDLVDSPQTNVIAIPDNGCDPLNVVFINTSLNADNFSWDFGNGQTQNSNDTSAVSHLFSSSTATVFDVQIIATQSGNCPDTSVISITLDICGCTDPIALNYNPIATLDDGSCIQPDPIIEAPNVFTPNGDNSNDLYQLNWSNLISLELTILNRWGNVVYQKTSSDLNTDEPAWNGKIQNNGNLAEDGIYFYRYKGVGITGKEVEGHGFLHLFKDN